MRPKGKLFALFAIFAAIGLVTATGAFTSVSAQRTAEVSTAGDASALLAMQPAPGANGNAYARNNSGEVEISLNASFDSQGSTASGVNPNATTRVNDVIQLTNQGTQTVYVTIQRTGNTPTAVTFYNESISSSNNITAGSGNAMQLTVGESSNVSMKIDTTGIGSQSDLLDSITIVANSTSQATGT